jgi:tRNA(fMet)-specific endonuclease VapC
MMSLRYLLDTNVISEPLKEKPNLEVIQKIQLHETQIAIACFVVYELVRGAYLLPESRKRYKLLDYIESVLMKFPVLSYSKEIAYRHGKEAAQQQKLGKTISFVDAQIAAIAKANNLTLVTRNTNDFENVIDLKTENWFE